MSLERQTEFLSTLTVKATEDSRVRAAWLEGSWGRGTHDRYSDLDIHLLIEPAQVEAFRDEAQSWLEHIRPLVLYNLLFEGRMINGLTQDGLRLDVWLHTDDVAKVDSDRAHILFARNGALSYANAQPEKDKAATVDTLLRQTKEFWRCISLTPSVIGRRELISSFMGLAIETNIVIDLLSTGYDINREAGVRHVNRFLPDDTQAQIEKILAGLDFSPEGLVKAHLALAELVREHGPKIAKRHGYAYPHDLEEAALNYVREELSALTT